MVPNHARWLDTASSMSSRRYHGTTLYCGLRTAWASVSDLANNASCFAESRKRRALLELPATRIPWYFLQNTITALSSAENEAGGDRQHGATGRRRRCAQVNPNSHRDHWRSWRWQYGMCGRSLRPAFLWMVAECTQSR